MPRPTVLVATTNAAMAYALDSRLSKACLSLGLKLEVCPEGDGEEQDFGNKKIRAYSCAEALFDRLDSVSRSDPMGLADTLVVLDVGANLEDAFSPAVNGRDRWHVTKQRRAGVAVELILRFPQVFPVILSPAVPVEKPSDAGMKKIIWPVCPRYVDSDAWRGFSQLKEALCKLDRLPGENAILALSTPLHFVSPLDGGSGLFSTIARFARGMRCWFDPTGLRTLVKNRFLGTLFGSRDGWATTADQRKVLLARLGRVAVAIDEEREFAMLNAYAAYKFGRRAWMVTTFAEFDDHPLWVSSPDTDGEVDVIVLRDIDLRFPDLPDTDPSQKRAEAAEKLEASKRPLRTQLLSIQSPIWKTNSNGSSRLGETWRVRAVSSHPDVVDSVNSLWCAEQHRLGELAGSYHGLAKPIASLYELPRLLEKSGARSDSVPSRLGSVATTGTGGHGAPYLNLAMAESLLLQGKYCKNGPVENMFGALYAGEAYELLLGMSKTTALEALLAQHKHEVAAEVMFPGVSHAIDIKPRRKDIEITLKNLTKMDGSASGRNKSVRHMFLSQFWAELKVVYSDGEQFTATEMANKRSLIHGRYFQNAFIDAGWRGIKWLLVPVATSFGWWAVASMASIVLSTAYYACVSSFSFGELVLSAALSSITLQPTSHIDQILKDPSSQQLFAGIFHMGLSYLLFGVLISMLYRKVTRG